MKKLSLLLLISLVSLSLSAQISKKEAVEKKIMSVEEWETDLETRKPKPVQESLTKYDPNGNLIEIIERDNIGEISLHEKYEFDTKGNKISEIQYNSSGVVKKKHVYTYDGDLRILRKTYNSEGKLIAEKKYIYKYFDK